MEQNEKKTDAHCSQIYLDHFWLICDASDDRRCKSVHIILQNLHRQIQNRQLNDLNYCVNRLIRGLTSSNGFARHGFTVLLTKIFETFPQEIDLNEIDRIAIKEFGDFKHDSDSTTTIAWTLLISCLLKSNRIDFENDQEGFEKIFRTLLLIGSKKNYVELVICELISAIFSKIQISDRDSSSWRFVVKKIRTLESRENKVFQAFLLLSLYVKDPSNHQSLVIDQIFKNKDDDHRHFISLLKETTRYLPNRHPIIELLLHVFHRIETKIRIKNQFYQKVIEEMFKIDLTKTSLGLEIISVVLNQSIESDQIKIIFNENVIRLMIQSMSNSRHPLHEKMKLFQQNLIEFVANNRDEPAVQFELARCLIQKPGSINFDELSKSKLMHNIFKNFNLISLKKWIELLIDLLIEHEDVPPSDFYRVKCLQQIVQLSKLSEAIELDFLKQCCQFILIHSYFNLDQCDDQSLKKYPIAMKRFEYSINDKLRKQFEISLAILLPYICSRSERNTHRLKSQIQSLQEFYNILDDLLKVPEIQLADKLLSLAKIKKFFFRISEKIKSLDRAKTGNEEMTDVFRLLYLYFALELFNNFNDIESIIFDFDECVNRALFTGVNKGKQPSKSDEPAWSDVLLELFISMMVKSKNIKNIILKIFKYIVPYITEIGIKTLLDALFSNETIDFQDSDDDEEEKEDEENDKTRNGDDKQEDEESNEDYDDDDDDDDDLEEENDNEVVDEQFRMDLMRILASAKTNGEKKSNDENGDEQNNSDSDENVSDSEMFKLDESLAEVFRKKFGEKKQEMERKNFIQSFRIRILEMLLILVDPHHHHYQNINVETIITIVMSVLQFMKFHRSSKNPLGNKAGQILTIQF
ncbi:hypothetical protein QR98_0061240 [Sarcoptes scabiei]|uniref:DNA polymerase V-like protein n=1 Tax=Sarcoptes scabiei TaxID=52283 RepID=A0A132AAK6_SARSC|nr:hypothetical protein QR98_0061240 [Sarcoptes scabiei]